MTTTLEIRLRRGRDGPDSLTLTREDGTVTWQHLPRGQAQHDLAHHAVESCLGFRDAFYGLVARGQDISDFDNRDTRGDTPDEAMLTEFLVNQILLEHASGEFTEAEEFNAVMLWTLQNHGGGDLARAHRAVRPEELATIRTTARELWRRWSQTAAGEALTLTFEFENR